MILRTATSSDDVVIGELLVTAFLKTYEKKMPEVVVTERRLKDLRDVRSRRESAHVLVLEDDGKIIGTVSLHKWGIPGCEAWTPGATCLRMMALSPEVQGRGHSKMLLEECLRLTKSWNSPALQLHIRKGALGLARMYEGLGFKRCPEGDLDLWPEIFLEAYEQRFS